MTSQKPFPPRTLAEALDDNAQENRPSVYSSRNVIKGEP